MKRRSTLFFGAPKKLRVLIHKCAWTCASLNDALLMDIEFSALQDDYDWWFASGRAALKVQEEVREESLQRGVPSLLEKDSSCLFAIVGKVSMALSTCIAGWSGSQHRDWFWWHLLCHFFAEVCSAVWCLYPIWYKTHQVEVWSFKRRLSKEGVHGGWSWHCSCLGVYERIPYCIAVDF